ncbi:metallophosphoesterase family protein [Halomonas cerina]|uniref:Icc protein n=1 Tax=Halomonas cerina TaxID=447424 RepID=A0A839VBY3_9GAMM|nr:metallophosphoesterase [Halomonas cerina]MBB3190909.1 Icc protein [Halomonas cerina]
MRLVQLTDCHLHADPAARSRIGLPLRQLEAVVAAAARERPDLALVTGDVSEDQTPASYRLAEQALAGLGCPWVWLPGNHDAPAPMAACHPFQECLELDGWRALLLDTQVVGEPRGELGKAQLSTLEARLAQDDRPTLLVMHHPPMAVGSAWLDALGLMDAEAFQDRVAPYGQVKAILCGHIHQAFAGWLPDPSGAPGTIRVYGCPATSDQFLPGSAAFAVEAATRPGYRIIDLKGNELTTRVTRVDP